MPRGNGHLPAKFDPIAIIGMRGRFPGADTLDSFWNNLARGVESIATLSEEDMRACGVAPDVWRLPGMRLDDPVISSNETRIEDPAYDALFTAGFYLYGWDVEWAHRHGIPRQSVPTMVDLLTGSHGRKPGKVVMLMHDVMMRDPKGPDKLVRIIEGVRDRGATFEPLSEY